jgi:hypothetical protein
VRWLLAFVPVAALLTITPGAATAMVVRSAVRGGPRRALLTTIGNSIGVLTWAAFAAVGVAAVVAASAEAFTAIKLVGAVVLVVLGLQSLRGRRAAQTVAAAPGGAPLRDGFVTSIANPKLAVFFAALFPQFVPDGASVLACALLRRRSSSRSTSSGTRRSPTWLRVRGALSWKDHGLRASSGSPVPFSSVWAYAWCSSGAEGGHLPTSRRGRR